MYCKFTDVAGISIHPCMSETKTRNSRWNDNLPVIRGGRVVEVRPSERERRDIFPILDERLDRTPWSYDILPLNYIHALTEGWNIDYLGDRLPALCRPPNRFLRRPLSQTANLKANSRFQVYAAADTSLNEDEFWHDLMANMIMAQIEIGVRQDRELQLANFTRILAAPSMPGDGSHSSIIEIMLPGNKYPAHVTADWQPFGIGKGRAFRFFFGIEADKGTEPLTTKSYTRQSIRGKLKRYLEIDVQALPKKLYGLPHFFFPFVTCIPERMQSMIELLYDLTNGEGHPRFIFNTFPVYNSYETPPAPDGAYFRSTWKRAWSSDFCMSEL
jgi:hypothetical protein